MKKNLLCVTLVVASSLFGESFAEFRAEALAKSPYLRANSLSVAQSEQLGQITTRYANPTLGLEASSFKQNSLAKRESGYRVELTQPLRLWGVGDARQQLATAQQKRAKATFALTKAQFLKTLSERFVYYKRLSALRKLADEELVIAQTIEHISHERFTNGTIAKVKYIQASLDRKRIENRVSEIEVVRTNAYYELLAFAGIEREVELQCNYTFELQQGTKSAPEMTLLEAKQQEALADAKLNTNKIEWIDVRIEYEKEPDQSIVRGGVEIPLAVFDTRSQEKQIARLEAKSSKLLIKQTQTANTHNLHRIEKTVAKLTKLQQTTQELQKQQQTLLKIYEDGYKIANINLVELQLIKNEMITTKKRLIEIETQKELQIIEYNYLTGAYNE